MTTTFDPTTYVPHRSTSTLAGFALAQEIELARFAALLDASTLAALDASLVGVPDAAGWRRHLIFDACIASLGSWGAVVDALESQP